MALHVHERDVCVRHLLMGAGQWPGDRAARDGELGLGAQRIVQDILAGFFIIAERQYGFGDLISLSVPGLPSPAIGTVEGVTLRVTTIRTASGEVVITPMATSPR
jgi:hypothetical protein